MTDASVAVSELREGRCRKESCPLFAATSGDCELGHVSPLDCPEFEPTDQGSVAATATDRDVSTTLTPKKDLRGRQPLIDSGSTVALYTSGALTARDASRLLYGRKAQIIVPLGRLRVGKTTLLAAIYERICRGPVLDLRFAGSRSLLGFEERCFEATFRSGRSTPDTPRTSRSVDDMFLHLRMQSVPEPHAEIDLLFADISGEHLDELIRYNEPGPISFLAPAATTIILLIDGGLLGDKKTGFQAITDARVSLRTLSERFRIADTVKIVACVTKWDKCHTTAGVDEVLERLESELASVRKTVELVKCAVRPEQGSGLGEGTGVDQLLTVALNTNPIAPISPSTEDDLARGGGRSLSTFSGGSAVLNRIMEIRKT